VISSLKDTVLDIHGLELANAYFRLALDKTHNIRTLVRVFHWVLPSSGTIGRRGPEYGPPGSNTYPVSSIWRSVAGDWPHSYPSLREWSSTWPVTFVPTRPPEKIALVIFDALTDSPPLWADKLSVLRLCVAPKDKGELRCFLSFAQEIQALRVLWLSFQGPQEDNRQLFDNLSIPFDTSAYAQFCLPRIEELKITGSYAVLDALFQVNKTLLCGVSLESDATFRFVAHHCGRCTSTPPTLPPCPNGANAK
jgi:hypothetical protein